MRTRRRRRTKYTWLPLLGTDNTTSTVNGRTTTRTFSLDIPEDGSPVLGVSAITFDLDQDEKLVPTTTPLIDQLGNEYFIKRIVGKNFVDQFIAPTIAVNDASVPAIIVTSAIFVARQDEGAPGGPISWATEPTLYNPACTEVIREPWIWRRQWILGNQGVRTGGFEQGTNISQGTCYPLSNAQYGSVYDGPHVDAKTARRVRQEERLFFTTSAQTYPPRATITNATVIINSGFDFRILGALRKAKNRGSF